MTINSEQNKISKRISFLFFKRGIDIFKEIIRPRIFYISKEVVVYIL